jgi:leucyl-tRNA synthetase
MGMQHDLIRRYIELQALLITVIAPHWAEYIWRDVLKKVCVKIAMPRIQ